MFRWLLFFALFFSVETWSQSDTYNTQISLIEALNDEQAIARIESMLEQKKFAPPQRVQLLLLQSRRYLSQGNFAKAAKSSQTSSALALRFQLFDLKAKANKLQGIVAYYQGKGNKALAYYQQALTYYQRNKTPNTSKGIAENSIAKANLLSNIALVYTSLGDSISALKSYEEADVFYQRFGDEMDKVDIRYNLATLYISVRRYQLAIDMLEDVIEQRLVLKDDYGMAKASADLGVAYKYSGQYQKAIQYNLTALNYFQQHNNKFEIASQLHNIAEVYYELGQVDKTLIYAHEAVDISSEIGHQKAFAGSLFSLAKAYFYQNEIEKALNYKQQAEIVAKELGYQALLNESLGLQALINAAKGQTSKALSTQSAYQKVSIEQTNAQLNEQLARFESEQLTQQVANLRQKEKLQILQITKTQQQRNFIIIGVVLTLIVVFLIYRRYLERQLTKKLEEGVKQRTQALEVITKKLQSANQVKSQFLANMSHEIRTPLTTVIGQSEAIIHGDIEAKLITQEVEIIHNNSLHLLQLINDILDISKIEADKFELEERPQDLHEIIHELEGMFSKQASQKHLAFSISHHLPIPYIITIDGFRLKQILINLCSNAIKFTEQGWVSLDISIVDKTLYFTITDTGIGMDEMQMGKIFSSFTQADNSISRRFSGSGLGLFVSNQLTQVMSGDLSVTSNIGQGSTFILKIPINEVKSSQHVIEEKTVRSSSTNMAIFTGKIVLADDHDDNRRLIARLLTRLGLEVIEATNGKEALEQCMQHQPSVTLLDIQMPEMDGITALKKLREMGCTHAIYALTANAMAHEIKQYLALGFDGHLKKPIEREKFIEVISKHYPNLKPSKQQINQCMDETDISDLTFAFQQHLVQDYVDIEVLQRVQNYQKLAEVVHKISGAANMFGFKELSQSASEVELVIKKKAYSKVEDLTFCLLDEINLVKNTHN